MATLTQEEHEKLIKELTDKLTEQINTLTSTNLSLTKSNKELTEKCTQLTTNYTNSLTKIKAHESTIEALHKDIKSKSQPSPKPKSLKETLKELL